MSIDTTAYLTTATTTSSTVYVTAPRNNYVGRHRRPSLRRTYLAAALSLFGISLKGATA
jgi:hypothetical protein